MTNNTWHYLRNQFLEATEDSMGNAMRISLFHYNKLDSVKTESDFLQDRYKYYQPLHEALQAEWQAWKDSGGAHKGQTLGITQLIDLLSSTRIRQWDVAIQAVYDAGTPEYVNLLPNRRQPFQKGSVQDRISAVTGLRNKLSTDTRLSGLYNTVRDFESDLTGNRSIQQQHIMRTTALSDTAEAARVAMCIGQYANLGFMMGQWAATPEVIGLYFDEAHIREHQQRSFKAGVKAAAHKAIVQHTFAEEDEIRLQNDGDAALRFYLGESADAASGTTGIVLEPNEARTVTAAELGDIANRYLIAANEGERAGHCMVTLL